MFVILWIISGIFFSGLYLKYNDFTRSELLKTPRTIQNLTVSDIFLWIIVGPAAGGLIWLFGCIWWWMDWFFDNYGDAKPFEKEASNDSTTDV
tara:strand:- start:346 stop:624 length:279 start_codon:yes stop_codon:yes gene_type:complete